MNKNRPSLNVQSTPLQQMPTDPEGMMKQMMQMSNMLQELKELQQQFRYNTEEIAKLNRKVDGYMKAVKAMVES